MNHLNATETSNINTPGVLDTATETSIGFAVGGISGTVISIMSATALPAIPIVPILAPITLSIIGAVKGYRNGKRRTEQSSTSFAEPSEIVLPEFSEDHGKAK